MRSRMPANPGHDLERFLVRVVFCMFADDTGVFETRDIFLDFIATRTRGGVACMLFFGLGREAMRRLAWLAGVCAVLMASSAYSQHRAGDVYAGAALGMAWHPDIEEFSHVIEDLVRQAGFTDFNLSSYEDDKAFAWSAYAGYALNEHFAIEAGYLGSDKVSIRLDLAGTLHGEQLRTEADAKARRWSLYGALVGHVPIDYSVKPFAKIGVRRWYDEYESRWSDAYGPTSTPATYFESSEVDHDNGFGLLLGVGADAPITEAVSFRIEYLYLPLSDEYGGDEHRAHVGMYYTF